MGWYNTISIDIKKIPDAILYFNTEYEQARKECRIYGNLEKASASLPGIVEHRFQQLQEIEAVLNYLNIKLRKTRRKHFQKYLFLDFYFQMSLM